jgi:fructose-1,6-bisphosphatase/inositol monophosphatase family enzyme
MADLDVMALANVLRDAAKAEILPRFRRLDPATVRQKSEAIDLVTEADEQAEHFIRREVAKLLPQAAFVGEEAVAADPALLDQVGKADLVVIVDPVDGTANFTAGLPLFAVMASVVAKGETVAGIIYDPMGDDWFVAEKGGGAWLRRPDGDAVRLQVADAVPVNEMVGTVSMAFLPPHKRAEILTNLDKIRVPANYRVAGHDYRLLSSGHTQFAMFHKLMPWDHLAGTLITEEAGGYAARYDGSPYRPGQTDGGLLLAVDKDAWTQLRREVFTF